MTRLHPIADATPELPDKERMVRRMCERHNLEMAPQASRIFLSIAVESNSSEGKQ